MVRVTNLRCQCFYLYCFCMFFYWITTLTLTGLYRPHTKLFNRTFPSTSRVALSENIQTSDKISVIPRRFYHTTIYFLTTPTLHPLSDFLVTLLITYNLLSTGLFFRSIIRFVFLLEERLTRSLETDGKDRDVGGELYHCLNLNLKRYKITQPTKPSRPNLTETPFWFPLLQPSLVTP